MKTSIAKLLLLMLAVTLVISACSGNSKSNGETSSSPPASNSASGESGSASPEASQETEQIDPYGKYETPISFTMSKPDTPDNKLPDGDTLENNWYTRYIEQTLNVKITHDWTAQGDAYTQKFSLSLSSGNLPDVMFVSSEKDLRSLVEADLIEDLTEVYEKYASPLLKGFYASTGEGVALKTSTFDGKLMALPDLNVKANGVQLLWLRQDWLDNLKLAPPKTIDELADVLKAFKAHEPSSVGLTGDPNLMQYNQLHTWNSLFAAMGSYPKQWVKDADGKLVYGSITPETKTALAKLRELYADGLIDKEFAIHKQEEENALIASGKSGAMFGPWWLTWWPLADTVKNNPKAEWRAYALPQDGSGMFNTPMPPINNGYIVVRKGYANPEAAVKVLNVQQRAIVNEDEVFNNAPETKTYREIGAHWTNFPFNLSIAYFNQVEDDALLARDVLEGRKSEDELKVATAKAWYDMALAEKNEPKKDTNAWAHWVVVNSSGPAMAEPMNLHYSEFYGTTETMLTKATVLEKLESETFLRIILGTSGLEEFDSFVDKWKKLGGDEITAEVNAAVASN